MAGLKKIILAALVMLLLTAGCSKTVTREEFFQAYQVRSGTVVEIINPNGSVKISGWDEDRVEIKALKESIFGQEALEAVDINIDIADTLVIETVHPRDITRVSVNYDIKLPTDLLVGLIECANGNISLDNVGGNPDLFTSNGTIKATQVNGILSAHTSNGDIEASAVRSLAELNTSNGSIVAELPTLYENVDIKTSNGSVTLYIPAALEADIRASTSNGTISYNGLTLDVTSGDQTNLVGKMNKGGLKIRLATSNGSIKLEKLK